MGCIMAASILCRVDISHAGNFKEAKNKALDAIHVVNDDDF